MRLIDADAAIKEIERLTEGENRKYNSFNAEWISDFLDAFPDAKPMVCPECKMRFFTERDYCPECGSPLKEAEQ